MPRKPDKIELYNGGMDMIADVDIERISGTIKQQERLINNAVEACKRSTTDWSKNFWFKTFQTLCKKFKRDDLYRKHLH
tara:strand:+ start:239 stop:475 length:237 start_codon:yes stop_codon:yes gene_type:complete